MDSLRRDHLGCYGYQRDTTPRIDRLAAAGARYAGLVAASSWTLPCMMTVFTSLTPSSHTVHSPTHALPDGITTLAMELQKSGYQTAGITSNPLVGRKYGFGHGFDYYDDTTIAFSAALDIPGEDPEPCRGIHNTPTGDVVTGLAKKWMADIRAPDRPYFLFLMYFDPHYDYMPPPPYDKTFTNPDYGGMQSGAGITGLRGKSLSAEDRNQIMALYDGEIKYTDEQIGKILDLIDSNDSLATNTAVILIGDHGEEFWEHNGVGHGQSLYDEVLLVPLIIRYPGLIPKPMVHDVFARQIDVMPTILELAGLPVPAHCEGIGLMTGRAPQNTAINCPPTAAISELMRMQGMISMRLPDAKIIESGGEPRCEIYNLAADSREQNNLADGKLTPALVKLQEELQGWKKARSKREIQPRPATFQLDPKLLEQLRTLGYMQ